MVRFSRRRCGAATLIRVNPRRCMLTHMGFTAAITLEEKKHDLIHHLDPINHGPTNGLSSSATTLRSFFEKLSVWSCALSTPYAPRQGFLRCSSYNETKISRLDCGFWGLQPDPPSPCSSPNVNIPVIAGSSFVFHRRWDYPRMIYVCTFKALCCKSRPLVKIGASDLFCQLSANQPMVVWPGFMPANPEFSPLRSFALDSSFKVPTPGDPKPWDFDRLCLGPCQEWVRWALKNNMQSEPRELGARFHFVPSHVTVKAAR
ncbi:hypothetical protein BJX76DRAFT_35122 [Aspergillus varians]